MKYFTRILAAALLSVGLVGTVLAETLITPSDNWDLRDSTSGRQFSANGILTCETADNGDFYDVVFYRLSDLKKFMVDSDDELFNLVCAGESSLQMTLNGTLNLSTIFGLSRIEVDHYETIKKLTAEETADYLARDIARAPIPDQKARLQ